MLRVFEGNTHNQASSQPTDSWLLRTEYLGLLILEPLFGEHSLVIQRDEMLELGGGIFWRPSGQQDFADQKAASNARQIAPVRSNKILT